MKGFDASGSLVAVFPATVGSEEKPTPSGKFKVVSIDGTKDATNLVLSGEEYAVVQSNPRLGQLVFETLDKFVKGEDLPAWTVQPDKVFKKADGTAAAYLPDAF